MDPHETERESREQTTEDGHERPDPALFESRRSSMLRWLGLGSVGLAGVLAIVFTLVLPLMVAQPEEEPVPALVVPPPSEPLAYEEPLSADLQAQSIHVDALLMRTLLELGARPDSIESHAFPALGSEDFRARSMGFEIPVTPVAFQKHLADLLKAELPDAVLTPSGPRQFSIILEGVRTHELFLDSVQKAQPYAPTPPALPAEVVGKLAIVIDDMGEDTRLARGLADTGLDITFAVWPLSSHKDTVCSIARETDLDLIIHLPMEPMGFPEHHPGPDALYTTMSAEEIAATVDKNLELVPEAIGVNNHMGSRFTADFFGMTAALRAMGQRGLFFLDSRTTGKSKGSAAAKEAGIPFYGRDVFIDNKKNHAYILGQLKKAEALARRRGSAIAIGHPHQETLEAIRAWAAQSRGDVAVVGISGLEPIMP